MSTEDENQLVGCSYSKEGKGGLYSKENSNCIGGFLRGLREFFKLINVVIIFLKLKIY